MTPAPPRDTERVRNPLLIVDGANVVGSIPDGWWRDRVGAARRLRDTLVPLAESGLDVTGAGVPIDIVLVVEGKASGLRGTAGVDVVAAPGEGDDTIVELAEAATGRTCVVVTADRELRDRVRAAGAEVVGPRTVYP